MYILYADESGNTGTDYDNKEQPIFVLGGLIIEDKKWHEINKIFNEEKIKICPELRYTEIHASEFFNSSKKSIFDKYDWKDNLMTVERLIDLILSLDISFQYIAIDKKSFKRSITDMFGNSIKIDPYIYAFGMLYDKISIYLNNQKSKGLIFLDDILTIPEQLQNIYPVLSKNNTTIIENAMFLKSKDTNFIQIADIFAFYINKYICIKRNYKKYSETKEKHCIDMYEKLSSKTNFINSEILVKYIPFKTKNHYK